MTSLIVLLSSNADVPTSYLTQQMLDFTSHYACVAFNVVSMTCYLPRFYLLKPFLLKTLSSEANHILTLLFKFLPYNDVYVISHGLNRNSFSSSNLDRFLPQQDTSATVAPMTPLDIVTNRIPM